MTSLYSSINKSCFLYTRKDTIKSCIYVKELIRFFLWPIENSKDGIWNCALESTYNIEQICESMKKVTGIDKNRIPTVPGKLLLSLASIVDPLGEKSVGIHQVRVNKLLN